MTLTYLKIILYALEWNLIRLLAKVLSWPLAPAPKLTKIQKATLNGSFKALLGHWKVLIKKHPEINRLQSPSQHMTRFNYILHDLKTFLSRKENKESHDISPEFSQIDGPEYFKRNYHYQTDGYFSLESAYRYDHQIELLFLGTGHIMRKVAYSLLKDVIPENEKVLEFGAASGTSGHQFKQLFPNVSLDILEPSQNYLDYAQKLYPQCFNLRIQAFMESFRASHKYGCVFSCFVMHEIPVIHWDEVIQSIKNSLRSDGHLLIIDSQQNCDKAEHQFALDQFEVDFFEPYFADYRVTPLAEYFEARGFKLIRSEEVLFSKSLLFQLID